MTAMATKEKFITNLLAPWGECLYSIFVEMCVRKLFSLGVYSFFKLVLAMPLFPETEYIALNNLFPKRSTKMSLTEENVYTAKTIQVPKLETFKVLKLSEV